MAWTYAQRSGELKHNGLHIWTCYSGHGTGKNNPGAEEEAGVGPIPCGGYVIGEPFDSHHTGPHAMKLTPMPTTRTFGRSEFEMHGDSLEHPGAASHGCIIAPRPIREQVSKSGDNMLLVTP